MQVGGCGVDAGFSKAFSDPFIDHARNPVVFGPFGPSFPLYFRETGQSQGLSDHP